jgi:hypothetical protein
MGVEGHHFSDLSTLLIDIVLEQITEVFRYLVPKLNAHADIRNTAKECLQFRLGVVAIAVSREIGQDTLEFVPCGEGTIGPDHNVVAIGKIAERQELAHSRDLHAFFVFRVGQRHVFLPGLRLRVSVFNLASTILARGTMSSWKCEAKTMLANAA